MKNRENKTKGAYASLSGAKRAVPIILFALALFTGLCFVTPDDVGLGKYIGGFFTGLFSVGGYFIPILLAVHGIFYPSDVQKKRALTRCIFSVMTLLLFSALLHTIKSFSVEMSFSPEEFYAAGRELSGGGFFGGIIGWGLAKVFGHVGLIIIAVLIFALYIVYFFANGKSTLARMLLFILDKISDSHAASKKKKEERKAKREAKRREAAAPRISEKHSDLYDDEFFAVDSGMSDLSIASLGIHETRSKADIEAHPHLEEKVRHEGEIFGADIPTEEPEIQEAAFEPVNEAAYSQESADEIFTKEFDPFNFEKNAEIAARQKERIKSQAEISEFAEPVRTFSEKDIEEARRRADFEMKKKSLMEMEERRRKEDAERLAREEAELRAREEEIRIAREKERQAMEEEAAKEARLRELLADDPSPSKATYTSYERVEIPTERVMDTSIPFEDKPVISDDEPYYTERELKLEEDTEFSYSVEPEEPAAIGNEDKYRRAASFVSALNSYEEESRIQRLKKQEAERRAEEKRAMSLSGEDSSANTSSDIRDGTIDEPLVLRRSMLEPELESNPDDEDEEELSREELEPEDEDADSIFADPLLADMQNPDVIAYQNMYSNVLEINTTPSAGVNADYTADAPGSTEEKLEADEPPFDMPKASPTPTPKPKEDKPKGPDYSGYKMPSLDLLKKSSTEIDMVAVQDEVNRNAEKLIETLDQFNVKATIRSTDVGPRITRYEVVPAKGVRVNSVMSLIDDISLNLEAEGMRMEAPIPGKAAIGIEIPNKKPQTVFLRDLLETEEFKNASSTTMACFGKDVTGNPVLGDIAKMPHMLIAGATGMGKSVCINSILISMLYRARPDELKFIMIDPKMVEFNGYNGIPHLLIPVIIDVKQAAGALMWAVEQMDKRFEILKEFNVRNLDGYNEKMRENPSLGEPLPKIIIVIDELNDLMLQARKPVEDLIMRIAQKARAAGIHLIIGTQRPSVDVITGVIKANIPSRISCKVASHTDSKTILEQAGAEKLLNNGDMLFFPVGKPKPTRVQGAFISDGEVERIMTFLKSQNKGSAYDEQALEEINRAAQKCAKGGKDDRGDDGDDGDAGAGYFNDPQFLEAVDLAIKQGKIATSLIQRKIGVGYGRAAKFIDIMESQGIVSEPNGQKPRDVLITSDEWHEILSRRSLD